ncbi:MAG: 6-phosphogluconolactonase [Patescibacteria group bacterium]|nr:6-phosphogluconolactonase [Patescibacteria group bacterium]
MTKFLVSRQTSAEAAAAAAGEALNNLLAGRQERPTLLLLSAGSALGLLDYVNTKSTDGHLTVGMLDERYSSNPAINNFARLQQTDFYARAMETDTSFLGSLPRSGETPQQLAARMENNLRSWQKDFPDGLIIATLGMGPDGHTAGMFPFPENPGKFKQLFDNQHWIVDYDAGKKHQFAQRVTATAALLRQVDVGLAYVCGTEKQAKLKELLAGQTTEPACLPALSWHGIKQITIFTDLEAV